MLFTKSSTIPGKRMLSTNIPQQPNEDSQSEPRGADLTAIWFDLHFGIAASALAAPFLPPLSGLP
jgi:hypothetical protein